jgi:hypothetical protein
MEYSEQQITHVQNNLYKPTHISTVAFGTLCFARICINMQQTLLSHLMRNSQYSRNNPHIRVPAPSNQLLRTPPLTTHICMSNDSEETR